MRSRIRRTAPATGVVTDYFHSGWFPTFNLADTAIVTGAGLLVLTTARHGTPDTGVGRRSQASGAFGTERT